MTQGQYNEIAYLLNQLECSPNELQIKCNDGEIHINCHTMNYTYIGKFGQSLCSFLSEKKVQLNDHTTKLYALAAFIDKYSTHNGGFNFLCK